MTGFMIYKDASIFFALKEDKGDQTMEEMDRIIITDEPKMELLGRMLSERL